MSLYENDVIPFLSPIAYDLQTVRGILNIFEGDAGIG
jgi:hypothetical protein